jgi:exopolyphosphatase/guanosine-5'-triphosphate,3'-diphosphate pyrophosphatase
MPPRAGSNAGAVAVIDIGSNSGRVAVYERDVAGHLRLVAGCRAPLRMVHDVDTMQQLGEETMARTIDALREFQAIAVGAGATRTVAVATAAMRDARNQRLFLDRVEHELGLRIRILSGRQEAAYGFNGAVRALAAADGLLFDLGGGSLQVSSFRNRRIATDVSLPFGALRMSEAWVRADPPTAKQLRRLREHIRAGLERARIGRLAAGTLLIGTGGTLRNLAKIDRESRPYQVRSLHGYELRSDRLEEIVERLTSTRKRRLDDIPGLSGGRADSVVGGAVVIQTLAEFVKARRILVSGHGLREGLALDAFGLRVGSAEAAKDAWLSSLVQRFDAWRPEAAVRRRAVATALQGALEPGAEKRLVGAIDRAAQVLDIGRSVDVVSRHEHVAAILLSTDITGFAHRDVALAAALLRRTGNRHADLSLIDDAIDAKQVERAAVILALADEIESRCPQGRRVTVACKVDRRVTITVRPLTSWLATDLGHRFERAFGRPLRVRFQG